MPGDSEPRYNARIGSLRARTRFTMSRRKLMLTFACAAMAFSAASFAQDKASTPRPADRLAVAEENAKQLLLLMDTDQNGKISKQEWMDFMSAEFDRLDVDHSGELDPHELLQSRLIVRHVRSSDQGK
jgi:hypothetical protein